MTGMTKREREVMNMLPAKKRKVFKRIDHHLRLICDSMDNELLKKIADIDGGGYQSQEWHVILHMFHCTVRAMGMDIDEFYGDVDNNPYYLYVVREYEKRLAVITVVCARSNGDISYYTR